MKNENYFQVEVSVNNETRKVAFAKGINREVNFANVKKLLAEMGLKGYRKAEMVQVFRAEDAIANGDIVLIDINGNEINKDNANGYYLIIDGQHRVYAASMLNREREKQGERTFQVPGILIELAENETIAEYISAVNITKMPWKTDDYIRGAAWKSHATLTLLAKQDLPTFGYNMIDPLKSWCWGSILFYPFKISRFFRP